MNHCKECNSDIADRPCVTDAEVMNCSFHKMPATPTSRAVRLVPIKGRIEVHFLSTYRVLNPTTESLATLVTSLRQMGMNDKEVGATLVRFV